MTVRLQRLESSDEGTFGVIKINKLILFTGELPRRENRSNISCIPAGIYKCRWTYSNRFKRKMFLVDGVPDRAGIRIHAANLMGDVTLGYKAQLNGCIALGEKLGSIDGQKAVLLSVPAIRKFEKLMGGKPFELEITYA